MFEYDPENPDKEEIKYENGNKKIIIYHYPKGTDDRGHKLESTCMTTEIYDKEDKLISKTTEKNPHKKY